MWFFDIKKYQRGNKKSAWVSTAVFGLIIGFGVSGFFLGTNPRATFADTFIPTMVISLSIAFSIHLLFEWVFRVVAPERVDAWARHWKILLYVAVPMLGMTLGYTIGFALLGQNFIASMIDDLRQAKRLVLIALIAVLILYTTVMERAKKFKHEAELEREKARVTDLQRRATEAELRTLQSQIEPHFLFNTLANVVSLIDYDAPQAKRMLEAFIDYLRASLDANRRTHATVGDELKLVEHYLQLLQIRLGSRLHYAIVADEPAREMPLAPLMLQPLVENAVKYGIEPQVEGGGVSITARIQHDKLVLTVLDSGVGLNAASTARKGSGMALNNIRERLAALYGTQANLSLTSDDDAITGTGTLATIRIPIPINETTTPL
jgi:sensor histidine kinase YesM